MLGKTEGRRRRGWQKMRWLDSITDSMEINLSKLWEIVKDREAWHGVVKSWTQLSNQITLDQIQAPQSNCQDYRPDNWVFILFSLISQHLISSGFQERMGIWGRFSLTSVRAFFKVEEMCRSTILGSNFGSVSDLLDLLPT